MHTAHTPQNGRKERVVEKEGVFVHCTRLELP